MINRKIFLSGLSILSALSIMAGATFAFFSDSGTSSGNIFSSGTFDLKLSDNNETVVDNVSATWSASDMAPGGATVSATLNLRNSGTVAGDHVHFKAANTVTDNPASENDGSMAKHLAVTSMTYDAVNILPLFSDTNGNGRIDLEDLEAVGDGVNIGGLTNLGVDHPLVMGIWLDADTNNTYQGDSTSTIFTAALHQNAAQ